MTVDVAFWFGVFIGMICASGVFFFLELSQEEDNEGSET